MVLTTVLNSYGHETLEWLHLYKSNLEFDNTYQMILKGKQIHNFCLQGT